MVHSSPPNKDSRIGETGNHGGHRNVPSRVSLNTGLDSPLECGTGMWDWIIEMDCGTGIWDCNSILAPEPVPMLA